MTGRSSGTGIEAYLDLLLVELHGRARDVRRALADAETHLEDATAEGVAAGLSREEAERAAVERFGPPRTVARQNGGALGRPGRQIVLAVQGLACGSAPVPTPAQANG